MGKTLAAASRRVINPARAFTGRPVVDYDHLIDELIAAARESDAKVHEIAARASYAGDAQPYRVAEEPERDFEDVEDIFLSDRR